MRTEKKCANNGESIVKPTLQFTTKESDWVSPVDKLQTLFGSAI